MHEYHRAKFLAAQVKDVAPMMAFRIEIELGDVEMISAADVADTLQSVRQDLLRGMTGGKIFDTNGNSCGYWRFDSAGD